MVEPGSLMLVHFVEQQLEGWKFKRDHWPLHITLVPWFKVDDEEAVVRSLERLSTEVKHFSLTVGGEEKFGGKRKVPVNVIKNQGPVKRLHQWLLDSLAEADIAFHEQSFRGSQFVAHVTRHLVDKRQSNEGERVIVGGFHLVRLVDASTCEVDQEFFLKRR